MRQYLLITGYVRTGTSALVRLLNFDDRIFLTDEFGTFHDFESYGRYKKILNWSRLKNSRLKEYQCLSKKNIDPGIFLERLEEEKPIGQDIFKVLEEVACKKFEVMGDKAPISYLNKITQLIKTIPNLKIIFTMRDGRDVISSQIRKYRGEGRSADWTQPTIGKAQSCGHNWVGSAYLIDKFLVMYPHQTMLVRYEDLVVNKQEGIYEIQEFLNLDLKNLDDGGWYIPINFKIWKKEHPKMMNKLSDEFKKWLERFEYI